ncbi:hypothetical protein F4680DRAFT_416406 [Xylaria scruposa]|nr:hypothetical protein F4680DRAFT_416406 [Xylaria scruposa]
MASDLINDFVESYERELDFYALVASLAEERCRQALANNGIPAIVTSRAKRPDRLAEKIKNRNVEKQYKTHQDIRKDLVDLSGVRIALYFPSQEAQVAMLLPKLFVVKEVKKLGVASAHAVEPGNQSSLPEATYHNQFAGYRATHLRVELGADSLTSDRRRYGSAMIEIQVASLLMHAWSEVNHDLAYKTLNGNLSDAEVRMLDGINGLVRTGEIMLNQVRSSMESRIATQNKPFANYFELGAFVQQYAPYDASNEKYRMGSLSWLLYVTKHLGIDNPQALTKRLSAWKLSVGDTIRYPVVRSILDFLFTSLNKTNTNSPTSPFLLESLNTELAAKSSSITTMTVACRILAYACDSSVVGDEKGNISISFPPEYNLLQDRGYLDLEGVPSVLEDGQNSLKETVTKFWSWFSESDDPQLRVALGIGRTRGGNHAKELLQ